MGDRTINPLPCFVCGKELEHAGFPQDVVARFGYVPNQPSDATSFETSGHYGSTLFDPMNGAELWELAVCNDCCTPERLARTRILLRLRDRRGEAITWAQYHDRDFWVKRRSAPSGREDTK